MTNLNGIKMGFYFTRIKHFLPRCYGPLYKWSQSHKPLADLSIFMLLLLKSSFHSKVVQTEMGFLINILLRRNSHPLAIAWILGNISLLYVNMCFGLSFIFTLAKVMGPLSHERIAYCPNLKTLWSIMLKGWSVKSRFASLGVEGSASFCLEILLCLIWVVKCIFDG